MTLRTVALPKGTHTLVFDNRSGEVRGFSSKHPEGKLVPDPDRAPRL